MSAEHAKAWIPMQFRYSYSGTGDALMEISYDHKNFTPGGFCLTVPACRNAESPACAGQHRDLL